VSERGLLADLERAGVRLSLAGDDLRYQTRPGVSIAPYRDRITDHKPALVALLRKRAPVEATRPPAGWDGSLCAGCRWPALCRVLGPRGPHLAGGPCAAWPDDTMSASGD
jgi:hypothetical protein